MIPQAPPSAFIEKMDLRYKSITVDLTDLHKEEGWTLPPELFGPKARHIKCIGASIGYARADLLFEYETPCDHDKPEVNQD